MRCSTTQGWPALQCTQRQARGAARGRPEARRPHVRWAAFDRNGVLSVERATFSQPGFSHFPAGAAQQKLAAESVHAGHLHLPRHRKSVARGRRGADAPSSAPPPAHPASRGWGDGRGYAVGGRGLGCCAGVCARYGVCVMDMGFRGRRGGVGGERGAGCSGERPAAPTTSHHFTAGGDCFPGPKFRAPRRGHAAPYSIFGEFDGGSKLPHSTQLS